MPKTQRTALSDIITELGLSANVDPVIPLDDDDKTSALQVLLGPIKLGIRNLANPDKSKPNPVQISWHKSNEAAVKSIVGSRPMTQVTVPDGLWEATVKFNTLDRSVLEQVDKLDIGPYMVKTYFKKKCMLLMDVKVDQVYGAKDQKQTVTLMFRENRPK